MGCWSALNATKAYLRTLQLCKDCNGNQGSNSSNKVVEPECIEFISALAAGNQATLMVDIIASNGCLLSPSTLALAIAAQHTGGRLICICHDHEAIQQTKSHIEELDLARVVTFKVGDPCKVVKQYKNIDFVVVDRRIEDCEEVLFALDMNPNGSVIVMSNLSHGIQRENASSQVHHTRKCSSRGGIKSEILQIGGGMEVTKIGCRRGSNNRPKRTFLVYEE